MPPPDDTRVDSDIAAALAAGRDQDWEELWEAVEVLAGEGTFATWTGGDPAGVITVDGEERTLYRMPYPTYSESVERVRQHLGKLGLIVPFDWMKWEGTTRYGRNPEALASAPVTDAVRLLTAVIRAERFGEGNIEGALVSGVIQAALARIRSWYNENRSSASPR
ncbi:MAG TPA: DUF6508 domain-containing protein [Acidimicrobiia bacterium]|nr:DUF6508 domain-containing protein [Acidimicrobiia bacterium]